MKKLAFALIITGAFGLSNLEAQAVTNFVVSPPRMELSLSGGSSATEAVEITNQGADFLELKAYLMDWELGPEDSFVYRRPGSLKNSSSAWVRVNPQVIRLEPKDKQLVRITVSAPKEAQGSYWTVLFFESKPEPARGGRMGVTLSGRVGVLIYAVVAGTEARSGKILNLQVKKDKENKYNLSLTFENTGNLHYRPQGSWEIKNEAGKRVKKGEIEDFVVLPKTQRVREIPLGSAEGSEVLTPGKYTLSVVLDYGAPDLVGGDLIFEVPGAAPAPAGK